MSEQDGTGKPTKRRRSHQTSTLNSTTPHVPRRPANDNSKAWKAYWNKLGQPWRFEPEINEERQKHLNEHRSILPDIERSIYPFKARFKKDRKYLTM